MRGVGDATHPLEGQVVLLAGSRASVTLERLSELVERAQQHVREHRTEYDRQFERIDSPDLVFYLVDEGHWRDVGAELGLDERESDAIRRAHTEQFRRAGRRLDRQEEFETALEIREIVVADSTGEASE